MSKIGVMPGQPPLPSPTSDTPIPRVVFPYFKNLSPVSDLTVQAQIDRILKENYCGERRVSDGSILHPDLPKKSVTFVGYASSIFILLAGVIEMARIHGTEQGHDQQQHALNLGNDDRHMLMHQNKKPEPMPPPMDPEKDPPQLGLRVQ